MYLCFSRSGRITCSDASPKCPCLLIDDAELPQGTSRAFRSSEWAEDSVTCLQGVNVILKQYLRRIRHRVSLRRVVRIVTVWNIGCWFINRCICAMLDDCVLLTKPTIWDERVLRFYRGVYPIMIHSLAHWPVGQLVDPGGHVSTRSCRFFTDAIEGAEFSDSRHTPTRNIRDHACECLARHLLGGRPSQAKILNNLKNGTSPGPILHFLLKIECYGKVLHI